MEGASLLEVFNGHPAVNLFGAPGKPSYEGIWDGVLSAGRVIFGVATDDSHNYHDFAPWLSNPGRGWVMVQADELTQEAIVDGLASGRFYASTGVTLTRLECSAESIVLEIDHEHDFIYTIRFTGKDGVVLAESTGPAAEYRADGHEEYVRATVISSSGPRAWTQPVFPTRAWLGRDDELGALGGVPDLVRKPGQEPLDAWGCRRVHLFVGANAVLCSASRSRRSATEGHA